MSDVSLLFYEVYKCRYGGLQVHLNTFGKMLAGQLKAKDKKIAYFSLSVTFIVKIKD